MRAFLSHSSKDKGFVEGVAGLLKPGTFEIDSQTFDAGLVNAKAIATALQRCDLFCLFLSANSVNSPYVEFETLLGLEFLAKGTLTRFIAICLDDQAFAQASSEVRFFNIVRKSVSVESTARSIQGAMIAAASEGNLSAHPFIGRESQSLELERQVFDPQRPSTKALFASGNFGSGRRTLIQKFYQNNFPHVGRIFPSLNIGNFSGLEELYRKLVTALRPSMSARELVARATAFGIADEKEKRRQIAELINSALVAREAVFFIDTGGLLTDAGAFQPEIASIISLLQDRPHPPLAMIAPRMVPTRLRRSEEDVAYVGLRSLDRDDSERLAKRLFKNSNSSITPKQLGEIVTLADGHPYNLYRIFEEVEQRGIDAFLSNTIEFVNWKHRQSSEYLERSPLEDNDIIILSLLTIVPALDFQAIVDALPIEPVVASEALLKLSNLHIIENSGNLFTISPPLRIAVERDKRVDMPAGVRAEALKVLARTLAIRLDEGSAKLDLVDTAVLSSIESGLPSESITAALLLPSHYVWLAQRHYDQRHYSESIRLAKEGLKGANRLSSAGLVAACRYMCLAAARVGDAVTFDEGIRRLEQVADDSWAKSNIAHLRGFSARFHGNLPSAEEFFRESYRLSPGNVSTAREIAAICLARNNLDEAESFAREAQGYASRNAYVIDILIAILVKKLGKRAVSNPEIGALLDLLRDLDEESGRSFYTTRKAELEFLWGDNRRARALIEDAISKTSTIFEPRRIYAEILIKEGNTPKAKEVIDWMKEKVNSRDPRERRTNLRPYLETYSHYLTEIGRFDEAKEIYNDFSVFTENERNAAIRNIEIAQAFKGAGRG
jgi:tetratricopeptide (TPR) repeat protein